jgi:hypothetical protein
MYQITMIAYSDFPTASRTINYTSSCNPGGSLTLNQVQYGGIFQYLDCVSPGGIADVMYQATVTLPVRCSDWEFSWQEFCCPTSLFENLSDNSSPNSVDYLVSALLNNLVDNNNSPRYFDPPGHNICESQSDFQWRQRAIDPDADSLVFEIKDVAPLSWAVGYSAQNPFGAPNGMQVDAQKGIYTFKPFFPGLYLITSTVKDYRWDPTTVSWRLVGSITRSSNVQIWSFCDSTVMHWNFNIDSSLTKIPLAVDCRSDQIKLASSSSFLCSSLTNTDFVLFQPDGTSIPIIDANGNCIDDLADTLILDLHMPISQNGNHFLVSKQGFDGNTLTSACGYDLVVNDTTIIQVKNCNNVSLVEEETSFSLEVFPNPAYNYLEINRLESNVNDKMVYSVFSSRGELVLTGILKNRIDISQLTSGLYTLNVEGVWQIATKSFVKH